MAGRLHDEMVSFSFLEEPADTFVTKVMKPEVFDFCALAMLERPH